MFRRFGGKPSIAACRDCASDVRHTPGTLAQPLDKVEVVVLVQGLGLVRFA